MSPPPCVNPEVHCSLLVNGRCYDADESVLPPLARLLLDDPIGVVLDSFQHHSPTTEASYLDCSLVCWGHVESHLETEEV